MSTFVKHPDTSEMLPAEASGRMRPGDQLVDINGHSVEGLNAEEATSLIRQVTAREVAGGPFMKNRSPDYQAMIPAFQNFTFLFYVKTVFAYCFRVGFEKNEEASPDLDSRRPLVAWHGRFPASQQKKQTGDQPSLQSVLAPSTLAQATLSSDTKTLRPLHHHTYPRQGARAWKAEPSPSS